MASEKLQEIINELKQQGKMRFLDGDTDEQIAQFEKDKDVKLPSAFREWLMFSDGGEIFLPAGVQFYGIEHKPLINVSDEDRPSNEYVVIGALASGDPILAKKGKEQISIYNHEAGRIEDDEIYEDFFSFLKDLHDVLGIGE
jgi:hypothetical protein